MDGTDLSADAPARSRARPGAGGWVVFAAVMMLILGGLDALWGLAAVLNNEVVVVGWHGVVVADITTWGWINLILGFALVLGGGGLLAGMSVARR